MASQSVMVLAATASISSPYLIRRDSSKAAANPPQSGRLGETRLARRRPPARLLRDWSLGAPFASQRNDMAIVMRRPREGDLEQGWSRSRTRPFPATACRARGAAHI